jgi:hypothetical protein
MATMCNIHFKIYNKGRKHVTQWKNMYFAYKKNILEVFIVGGNIQGVIVKNIGVINNDI